jgi:lipopolysaccharide transport system permease protein
VTTDPAGEAPVRVIEASHGWTQIDLGELWRYRELLFSFTWRNVLIRYKQTVLGILWAILQPFFLMVVFSLFFGHFAKIPSNGVPYPIFAYVALLPWTFFQNSITQASISLVGNSNLLRKIYFPRLILPLASVLTSLVDFFVAFSILIVLMVYYDVYPDPLRALALPLLLLLAFGTAAGIGSLLAAMNIKYRDVQYVVPFLVQIWSFASFVQIPPSLVSEPWRTLFGLNPMAGVVTGFRWALLDGPAPGAMLWVSVGVAIVALVGGAFYFRRVERTFADVV